VSRFFDSLWPAVPVVGVVCAMLTLATLVAVVRGEARQRRHARALQGVRDQLSTLSASSRNGSHATRDLPLALVREASAGLPPVEVDRLRLTMIEAGAAKTSEARVTAARGRGRRAAELELLGWLRAETSIATLRAVLAGEDRELAYVAGQALAAYDSADAYAALIGALASAGLPRSRIATLLETSRYRGSARALGELASDPNVWVRFWVAYLLGRVQNESGVAALEQLTADADPYVRANAVEALGSLGHADAAEALMSDPDWVVRSHAARAVGAAGDADLGPQLAALLTDRVWWVRQNAARALIKLGAHAVPHVLPMLGSNDRFARNKAAEILIADGYVDELIGELASGAESAASRAWTVLAEVAGAGASASVRARLERAGNGSAERLLHDLEQPGSYAGARK
jgi:HEAT repeat protein